MAWTGRLLQRQNCDNGFEILRIDAGNASARAKPGCMASLGDAAYPVMRASSDMGWIEILTPQNAWQWPSGTAETITLLDGHAFTPSPERPIVLAVGNRLGLAPMVFLCDSLRRGSNVRITVLLGERHTFPFRPAPSRLIVPGLPAHVIATMPLLEDWHIACRLALPNERAGCHEGFAWELAEMWLAGADTRLPQTIVYISGDTPFCDRMTRLCERFAVACQIAPMSRPG